MVLAVINQSWLRARLESPIVFRIIEAIGWCFASITPHDGMSYQSPVGSGEKRYDWIASLKQACIAKPMHGSG